MGKLIKLYKSEDGGRAEVLENEQFSYDVEQVIKGHRHIKKLTTDDLEAAKRFAKELADKMG